ncbi:hypothetical protein BY996DRAFT_8683032 [Phakopsora pachyrhizi]|nr:hypothetical protein BY996DRAFT_8683032 [Phakopsora pachyrhizi]
MRINSLGIILCLATFSKRFALGFYKYVKEIPTSQPETDGQAVNDQRFILSSQESSMGCMRTDGSNKKLEPQTSQASTINEEPNRKKVRILVDLNDPLPNRRTARDIRLSGAYPLKSPVNERTGSNPQSVSASLNDPLPNRETVREVSLGGAYPLKNPFNERTGSNPQSVSASLNDPRRMTQAMGSFSHEPVLYSHQLNRFNQDKPPKLSGYSHIVESSEPLDIQTVAGNLNQFHNAQRKGKNKDLVLDEPYRLKIYESNRFNINSVSDSNSELSNLQEGRKIRSYEEQLDVIRGVTGKNSVNHYNEDGTQIEMNKLFERIEREKFERSLKTFLDPNQPVLTPKMIEYFHLRVSKLLESQVKVQMLIILQLIKEHNVYHERQYFYIKDAETSSFLNKPGFINFLRRFENYDELIYMDFNGKAEGSIRDMNFFTLLLSFLVEKGTTSLEGLRTNSWIARGTVSNIKQSRSSLKQSEIGKIFLIYSIVINKLFSEGDDKKSFILRQRQAIKFYNLAFGSIDFEKVDKINHINRNLLSEQNHSKLKSELDTFCKRFNDDINRPPSDIFSLAWTLVDFWLQEHRYHLPRRIRFEEITVNQLK